MKRRITRRLDAVTAVVLMLTAAAASGAGADGQAATESEDAAGRILSPTLGRPCFVQPGGSFYTLVTVPPEAQGVVFALVRADAPDLRYALTATEPAVSELAAGRPVALRTPPETPLHTYDLEVRIDGQRFVEPHCVGVTRAQDRWRIVHLSNLNIGSLGAPQLDLRLVDQVNLVAPDAIIATGDYLDATHDDPAAGWLRLADCFARFDAPLIAAAGDHDDLALYGRHLAPSPIGVATLGRHRVTVLYDQLGAPITRDDAQMQWLQETLPDAAFDGVTVMVSHDERPGLLELWRRQERLEEMLSSGRIGLWIVGGHRDWDGHEFQQLIHAAAPMLYVRTHESSSATSGGASGVPHFRVIELLGDHAAIPRDSGESLRAAPSIPVGRLQTSLSGPNDGGANELTFTVLNTLPYRLDRLALTLRIRKRSGAAPWCRGGRIEQVVEHAAFWECRVRIDLPDRGVVGGTIGSGPEPPRPEIEVTYEGPEELALYAQRSADGITFLTAPNLPIGVVIRNDGAETQTFLPLIRLDGDAIAYRPEDTAEPFVIGRTIRLEPGQAVRLRPDFSAIRVAPGRRELQVYLKGLPALVPFCFPLDVHTGEHAIEMADVTPSQN